MWRASGGREKERWGGRITGDTVNEVFSVQRHTHTHYTWQKPKHIHLHDDDDMLVECAEKQSEIHVVRPHEVHNHTYQRNPTWWINFIFMSNSFSVCIQRETALLYCFCVQIEVSLMSWDVYFSPSIWHPTQLFGFIQNHCVVLLFSCNLHVECNLFANVHAFVWSANCERYCMASNQAMANRKAFPDVSWGSMVCISHHDTFVWRRHQHPALQYTYFDIVFIRHVHACSRDMMWNLSIDIKNRNIQLKAHPRYVRWKRYQ